MLPIDFQITMHGSADYPEWGSSPRKPLVQLDFAHKGELMDSIMGTHPVTDKDMIYHILRCELCIGAHLFPLSTPDDLAYYYAQKFYQDTKPYYIQHNEEDRAWWMAIHRTVINAAQPWLPSTHVRMLDIGAGAGYALDVGKALGYATTALEPSSTAAAWQREHGHTVFATTLAPFHASAATHDAFDLLYCWEVLEHQPNPEDFLLQCYDLLAPGGVLVVCVPNDFTPAQFAACERFALPPWWIAPPDHQFYWTPKTLQLQLRRCGFTQRFMRMTFPLIEYFMLEQGRCYVGNPALGRLCHHERVAYELEMIGTGRWPELEAEYIANVAHRVGREIIMIGQKDA